MKTAGTKEPDIRGYVKNLLQSVELILKDTEFRKQLQSSTVLFTQVVMMLNNIEDEEVKIILIKLVGILGKNIENKIVIGKNDGFKKLLSLMVEQSEDLLKGIIDTFKQLLDIGSEKDQEYLISNVVDPQKMPAVGDIGSIPPDEIRSIFEKDNEELSPTGKFAPSLIAPKTKIEVVERPSYEVLQRMSIEIKKEQEILAKTNAGRLSDTNKEMGDKQNERGSKMTCVTLLRIMKAKKLLSLSKNQKGMQ